MTESNPGSGAAVDELTEHLELLAALLEDASAAMGAVEESGPGPAPRGE